MLHLEISRGEKITVAADWWSLGVLSYELITGKVDLLFTSISDIHNYNAIQSGLDLIIPKAKTNKIKNAFSCRGAGIWNVKIIGDSC